MFGPDQIMWPNMPSDIPFGLAQLGAFVYESALRFVLAHEYAHLLSGHVTRARERPVETEVGRIELAQKRMNEEYEADRLGCELLFGNVDALDALATEELMARVCGVLLFFTVHDLLTTVERALPEAMRVSGGRDHPPSVERRRRLCTTMTEWMSDIDREDIVQQAQALELVEKLPLMEDAILQTLQHLWRDQRPAGA
jgi:hypothetical protein